MQGRLVKKELLADSVYGFWFSIKGENFQFIPGQFLRWTLDHQNPDDRGIERFFTISSSPQEKELLLATKIPKNCSSYKQALKKLQKGDEIYVEGPNGDFVLPEEKDKKLVFIAGGIGVTPFRSMISHLLEKKESRKITLIYGVNSVKEIAFKEVFLKGEEKDILRNIFVVREIDESERGERMEDGQISKEVMSRYISEIEKALFYVSGPRGMVEAVSSLLADMGVEESNVKKDFFPGYEGI